MRKLFQLFKKDVTLSISFFAALVSCFFVHPDVQYLKYIDCKTLALLYCLMIVVAGLRNAGVFDILSHNLCLHAHSLRTLCFVLIILCFISSMLITNDVALLTFVPFAVVVLDQANALEKLPWVIALQTVAANLGSILTPVGNPQNLFLYSYYNFSIQEFLKIVFPIWMIAGLFLLVLILLESPKKIHVFLGEEPTVDIKSMIVYFCLFSICLLTVIRILPWYFMLGIVVLTLIIYQKKILKSADFGLLLTFVCFFIFSGNLGRMKSVEQILCNLLLGHELLCGIALSQIISNVPTALLLSGFTQNGKELLLGVDIGGLGTPIASLASLISLKLYLHSKGASVRKFLLLFLLLNFSLLILLTIITKLFL